MGLMALEQQMIQAESELIDPQKKAAIAAAEEQYRDITEGQAVKDALRAQQLEEISLSKPLAEKFYKETAEGPNVEERMGIATTDVEKEFGKMQGEERRELARYGLSPYAGNVGKTLREKAKAKAAARNIARRQAEDEKLAKLSLGMQVRGRASGLPGITSTDASKDQFGNVGVGNQAQTALSAFSGAAGTSATGLTPQSVKDRWRSSNWNMQASYGAG